MPFFCKRKKQTKNKTLKNLESNIYSTKKECVVKKVGTKMEADMLIPEKC